LNQVEKMAGLLLHRIAEGQFFIDGNKRTAVAAAAIFLKNHGLDLRLDRAVVSNLVWGFAKGLGGVPAKYTEEDAIQFVFDNVLPRI
jgi:prophage maintenance system killer protein